MQTDVDPSLRWRHNDHDGVSNHQPHGCSLNRLFRRRSKRTSKLRVTGLCVGNSPGPVNSPHKGPVTRKMFPFDDVIMIELWLVHASPKFDDLMYDFLVCPLSMHWRYQSLTLSHQYDIDGLVQDCSISIANTLEILQSCTEPSIWDTRQCYHPVHMVW